MHTQVSTCPKCGAPIYVPTIWHGVTPPCPIYSCSCNGSQNIVCTDNTSTLIVDFPTKTPPMSGPTSARKSASEYSYAKPGGVYFTNQSTFGGVNKDVYP